MSNNPKPIGRYGRKLTFRELRDGLNEFPESSLDLPVCVYSHRDGSNYAVSVLSMYDDDEPHSADNPMSFDLYDEDN